MKKILVIEDDNFLANAYRVKLSKSGYNVDIAMDGDDGLKKLANGIPDLIILDLVMPNRDGFSVLGEINQHPEWKTIPIIVASNLGQKEDIEKAMSLGARDYFIKTDMSMEQILQKIESIVGK